MMRAAGCARCGNASAVNSSICTGKVPFKTAQPGGCRARLSHRMQSGKPRREEDGVRVQGVKCSEFTDCRLPGCGTRPALMCRHLLLRWGNRRIRLSHTGLSSAWHGRGQGAGGRRSGPASSTVLNHQASNGRCRRNRQAQGGPDATLD